MAAISPVPVHGLWARLRGLTSGVDYRRCRTIPNLMKRDYQLKAAMARAFPPGRIATAGLIRVP